MSRTVKHTRTVTEELLPPWKYRLQGFLAGVGLMLTLLLLLALLAGAGY